MEQPLNELGLLIPLVDLVEEGLQNILNGLVWLGPDVSNQLVVALTLVLTEHLLDSYLCQKDDISKQNMYAKIGCQVPSHINEVLPHFRHLFTILTVTALG